MKRLLLVIFLLVSIGVMASKDYQIISQTRYPSLSQVTNR